jgi:hypothetical protein
VRELERHVAKTTEPDDAHALARLHVPVPQRRVRRDAGAEQRGRAGRIEVRRHAEREGLVHHDAVGVAAVGDAAGVLVAAVVGEDGAAGAELLEIVPALAAGPARVHEAAHGGGVAHLEPGDLVADAGHAAEDLVAGDGGPRGALPLAAHGVQVGVADAAVLDLDLHVARAGLAALEGEGGERTGGARGGIAEALDHGRS